MRQPFWKMKHDFLCMKIINMLYENRSASQIYNEIRSLMDFTTLENIEKYDIMETRGNKNVHWTKGEHGYFTGSVGSGSGSSGNLKLNDIQIGRSVGAKAKNYDIMDLKTGEKFHLVEGTRLQDVEVFAGKGVRTPYRNAWKYANKYGGKEQDWQHVKGKGVVDFHGEARDAELHWSQCSGIGKYEFFIKRWLN